MEQVFKTDKLNTIRYHRVPGLHCLENYCEKKSGQIEFHNLSFNFL